jgi:hypothetical protein
MTGAADDFIEAVPAKSPAAADEEFERWLVERGLDRVGLPDDAIRIDTIRGPGGLSLRRYRIRQSVLDQRSR